MGRRSAARVVETLEFELFSERFREWAAEHADELHRRLLERLPGLGAWDRFRIGELYLAMKRPEEGTELILRLSLPRSRQTG